MPVFPRFALAFVVVLLAALASGCAGRAPATKPTGNVLIPQGDLAADEKPEPLPPGMKPLTVEQEEMIAQ
ncbi:hypothetical protein RB623_15895 [Mesorhizobium sp. LHD-90]|uniref:hypothetical protein n=1 Tax=Mesorhizobium sp. LHD-90 TaxID=3071414 RepID=UPI0027DF2B09|nr:hypothetical protein [Mesorhizobium sp. LHD-90]MDQ6435540.1 hypothetical protein [Mesorhizobium sp. LHD-90]